MRAQAATISNWFLLVVATNIGRRLRAAYVSAILRQDVAWFDKNKTGAIITSVEEDCGNVQQAVGEKVSAVVQNFTTFFGGLIIA
jgi:ABC-type multidrug transport system fused ATPase/permease subunit